jgi:ABC-type transport system involved in multi-copper enzyme maturation permease subunit
VTLYTRGYRRYEDGFKARHLRFAPIYAESYRDAVRSRSFRVFLALFVAVMLFFAAVFYLVPRSFAPAGASPEVVAFGETLRSMRLREFVAQYLYVLDWLTPLLVLFVGSGLVADDLRTRALPLYLVRPITPFDYWLGKFLVPAGVLGVAFLLPALFLVLFGISLEPSGNVTSFAAKQGPLLLGVVSAYVAAAAAYGSLVLLVSTLTGRRLRAAIFGGAVIFLSPVVVGLVVMAKTHDGKTPEAAVGGPIEFVKSLMLPGDVTSIFRTVSEAGFDRHQKLILPSVEVAVATIVALTVAAAFVVIRRARTIEVVA